MAPIWHILELAIKSPYTVLYKNVPGNVEENFEEIFKHTTFSMKHPMSCSAFLSLHADFGMAVFGGQKEDRVDLKVFVCPTPDPQDNSASLFVKWTMTNLPERQQKPSAHIFLQMRTALSNISGRPL